MWVGWAPTPSGQIHQTKDHMHDFKQDSSLYVKCLSLLLFVCFLKGEVGWKWGENCHQEGEGYSGMALEHVPLLCRDQLKRAQLFHDAGEYRILYGTH